MCQHCQTLRSQPRSWRCSLSRFPMILRLRLHEKKISRALFYLVCQVTASSMYLPSKSHRGAKYLGYGNSSLPMLKCHEVNSVLWWKLCWGEKVWLKWKKRELNIIGCTLQGFDYWKVVDDIVCIGMNYGVSGRKLCLLCHVRHRRHNFFLFHILTTSPSFLSPSLSKKTKQTKQTNKQTNKNKNKTKLNFK